MTIINLDEEVEVSNPTWGFKTNPTNRIIIEEDLLYIIDKDDSQEIIYKNPKHRLSVKHDITTCKRRCKANSKGSQTTPLLPCGHLGY